MKNPEKTSAWAPLARGVGLAGQALAGFLPERWAATPDASDPADVGQTGAAPVATNLPPVEVTFLRCGYTRVPEFVAVRGGSLTRRVTIAHSAVLVRHPQATFLYDTGLCAQIRRELAGQSLIFQQSLARFTFTRALADHLRQRDLAPSDLAFALLSHLHWDHVSGVPDLPGVRLRVNRVEREAAERGILDAHHGLVRRLMRDNPVELFECDGPAYEGFPASRDLFGDGSLVLVPLPGHTMGNTGMFVNRANGPRLFLIGDAAWVAANFLRPATMHPLIWSAVTSDDAAARKTLLALRRFALRRPEVAIIAMHDAAAQDAAMRPAAPASAGAATTA